MLTGKEIHEKSIINVKINPANPDIFASASKDGFVKFWKTPIDKATG
jgi:hypothetical protein